jgi:hypothetical protein
MHTSSGIDLGLPMQRQMIRILGDEHFDLSPCFSSTDG